MKLSLNDQKVLEEALGDLIAKWEFLKNHHELQAHDSKAFTFGLKTKQAQYLLRRILQESTHDVFK